MTSISKPANQRKKRGTTISDTSEDLSVRLQRLLCEDESLSEPEDSSVLNEASSAIYSFSEDSEFGAKRMERMYKSLERPRKKTPATQKILRSSNVPIDDYSSDDEFVGRKTTKFDYKTL